MHRVTCALVPCLSPGGKKNINTSSLCSTGLFFSIQSAFAEFYTQTRCELLNLFYDLHSSVFQYSHCEE